MQYHLRGLKDEPALRRVLTRGLATLGELVRVASAEVVLERQQETTPAFQAVVSLAVPGADVQAAARDHTWAAAWQKVLSRLREQLEARQAPEEARPKSRSPARPFGSRRARAGAAAPG
ncbi:MAG: hypothetical protein FJ387_19010 [Verrucomicrobia bacterium]|nr:hypothetical protein [Verrucomicrobiota bacterium]